MIVNEETDESVLDYGINEAEVNKAILTEIIKPLDLKRVPLTVDIANIDSVDKETFALVRRNGFGGSDSSILVGVNPFKTVGELIKDKLRKELTEEEKAIGQLSAVRKGNDLEPLIIKKVMENFDLILFKPPHMYRFKEYPYLTMNFDGITELENRYIPIEIKVVTYKGEKHYNIMKCMFTEFSTETFEVTDCSMENISIEERAAHYGIPPYYFTQLQQEIMALDAPYGYLAMMFESDWTLRVYKVFRDPKTQDAIIIEGYKTWQLINKERMRKANI